MLKDRVIIMKAKFAGKCVNCGGKIEQGDSISYDKVARQASHKSCLEVKVDMSQAAKLGSFMGRDMAIRQHTRLLSLTGLVSRFNAAELLTNAANSARNQAHERRVPGQWLVEWKLAFVEAYSAAYKAAVAEYEQKDKVMEKRFGFIVNYRDGSKKTYFSDTASAPDGTLANAVSYACLDPQTGKSSYMRWGYPDDDPSRGPMWYWVMNLKLTDEERALFAEDPNNAHTN